MEHIRIAAYDGLHPASDFAEIVLDHVPGDHIALKAVRPDGTDATLAHELLQGDEDDGDVPDPRDRVLGMAQMYEDVLRREGTLRVRNFPFRQEAGVRIVTLRGDWDTDTDTDPTRDIERHAVPGTAGTLVAWNAFCDSPGGNWSVVFDNGTSVFLEEHELCDPSQYLTLDDYRALSEIMAKEHAG